MANNLQSTGRPGRNKLWLIGLGAAALLVGVLAANSQMSEGESAAHDYTATTRGAPAGGAGAPGG